MIYYVDGYNYLFTQGIERELFESSREEVLDFFSTNAHSFKIIVIFDAHKQRGVFSRVFYHGIEVVYSSYEQTADEYIIEQVLHAKKPHELAVVTNDQGLAKEIRRLKAHPISFENFFKKIEKKKPKPNEKANSKQFGSKEFQKYLQDFDL